MMAPLNTSTWLLTSVATNLYFWQIQYFEWDSLGDRRASWWQKFEAALPDLSELGFTQVWLPPPNKAMSPDGRGYDAYDLWDLGEFPHKGRVATRWGTKTQLLSAIREAKARGIEVVIDAVLNVSTLIRQWQTHPEWRAKHKLGGDVKEEIRAVEVDPMNRNREIGNEKTIEAWTGYRFKARNGRYSTMTWSSDHFTGTDWDARRRRKGVFKITGPGNHQGWNPRVDSELGNYDYLLGVDIDHRHPEVRDDFLKWGPWVLQETGASGGFRLDAIKHMDSQFLCEFLQHTRLSLQKPDLFAVGEYWTSDARFLIQRMLNFHGELSFFDVPLHHTFHEASKAGEAFDLRGIMQNSLMRLRPGDAVTFVDNHDTVRLSKRTLRF
ncbi:hypothetical protein FRC17_001125 [Serendipita sp. 399]|nr:hypothetical protein FRC17_001125 [Serendipita sp. 399]